MGVSGCGKSFIGQKLAKQLNFSFADGDDFHSNQNKDKMHRGLPLKDADRLTWLHELQAFLGGSDRSTILACSALKRSYRDILQAHSRQTIFIHLTGSHHLLQERLEGRRGHFFHPALLEDQLATLESLQTDEKGFSVKIEQSWQKIIAEIETRLKDIAFS